MRSFEKNGFSQLTDLQSKALPILLEGKSAIVHGEAASGKTLSYLIPVL